MKNILLVFVGGGVGSVIRYMAGQFFKSASPTFPYATFMVNVAGSFLIGLLMGLLMNDTAIQQNWKLLLITGFCGGFTTFSAFSKESFMMVQNQQWNVLFLYIFLSVTACIIATALGFFINGVGIR